MSPEAFGADLDSHRQEVHAVFNDLFRTPDEGDGKTGSAVHRFVNEAMDSESAEAWLASLGFEDAPQAASILESLRDAPAFGHSPSRMKNMLANVISALLETAPRLVRPGKVLTGFERLTSSMSAREVFFRSLLEAPESIPRLTRLFALSDWLSDTLIQRPGTAEFVIDKERLSRSLGPPFETESRRMFEFYVGIQYLFGVLERQRASLLMSSFAETQITRWLPPDGPVALIALGKFGEEELNYRSDLDVMAFFDGDYEESCQLVEELVEGVSGEFSIDLRLRPEGRKGSLVWDLKRTEEYLHSRAEVWERMAWTKARFVAGNLGVAEGLTPLIEEFVYGTEFGKAGIEEMRHIRGRMERELSREAPGVLNLKLGRGGLVDLEFLAEFIQIREGIRIPNTARVLAQASVSKELVEDYFFLRDVESMLRLWTSLSSSRIEEKDIPALEAMLELSDFKATYAEVTSRVRAAFDGYSG